MKYWLIWIWVPSIIWWIISVRNYLLINGDNYHESRLLRRLENNVWLTMRVNVASFVVPVLIMTIPFFGSIKAVVLSIIFFEIAIITKQISDNHKVPKEIESFDIQAVTMIEGCATLLFITSIASWIKETLLI